MHRVVESILQDQTTEVDNSSMVASLYNPKQDFVFLMMGRRCILQRKTYCWLA